MNKTRYLGTGTAWAKHCKENGGYDSNNIELLWWSWFEKETEAQKWLDIFEKCNPDYWLAEEWANRVPETTATNVFQNPRSNPANDPMWQATVGIVRAEKQSQSLKTTLNDPEWKESVGKVQRERLKQTINTPEWKESVGKVKAEKSSQTQNDPFWIETVGKVQREKLSQRLKERHADLEWKSDNYIFCLYCNKGPIDPGNYKRWHGNNCKQK